MRAKQYETVESQCTGRLSSASMRLPPACFFDPAQVCRHALALLCQISGSSRKIKDLRFRAKSRKSLISLELESESGRVVLEYRDTRRTAMCTWIQEVL